MIFASVFIGPAGSGEDVALPPLVAENIASMKRHHPGLPHRLFSGEDILAFLEANFPREVRDAYDALLPHAYKADLARYCILHELGGIYADLSSFFVRTLPFEGERPIVFRDLIGSTPWDTCTSVIASPPRHKAFARAIEMVCANVTRGYHGNTPLCPTGPTLFGKALATVCDAEDLTVGSAAAVRREQLHRDFPGVTLPEAARVYTLLLGGAPVAIKRKRMDVGGLGDLGVADSDDYAARWNRRDIYRSGSTP